MYEFLLLQSGSKQSAAQWDTGNSALAYILGNNNSGSITNGSGAIRFASVPLSQGQTIVDATLYFHVGFQQGSGNLRYKLYGIKETNTADFNTNPFGRPLTTAFVSDTKGLPGVNNTFSSSAYNQINEILGQGGWVSGNAMAFIAFNNGSDNPCYIEDDNEKAWLWIKTSSPNLTPTPINIAAPIFPPPDNYGIRVSQPGVDVQTAQESELFFTSRKKELRVNEEKVLSFTTSYPHGLPYAPCVVGYYADAGGKMRIMNVPTNIFSEEPWIASDATNIYMGGSSISLMYVYIFIDPLT